MLLNKIKNYILQGQVIYLKRLIKSEKFTIIYLLIFHFRTYLSRRINKKKKFLDAIK